MAKQLFAERASLRLFWPIVKTSPAKRNTGAFRLHKTSQGAAAGKTIDLECGKNDQFTHGNILGALKTQPQEQQENTGNDA